MRIAEGLIKRKEIAKKINRLNEEIAANLVSEEGSEPVKGFLTKRITELNLLSEELSVLNSKINIANSVNLSAQLNELKTLDSLISFHQKWRKALVSPSGVEGFYGRTEKKYVANFNIDLMNDKLEKLEEARRAVDKTLQRRNWEIDI